MPVTWLEGPMSWVGSLQKQKPGDLFVASKGPAAHEAQVLAKQLLDLGGTTVVVPFDAEAVSMFFVAEGAVSLATEIISKKGRENDCHGNAARLWKKTKGELTLVTGYALSNDGVWRRHSWVTDPGGRLVETTEPRELYFGVELRGDMAKGFHKAYA